MDPNALYQAKARMAKVSDAAAALQQAEQTFDSVQAHWIDLLTAANTIYSKLEQGAKADGKSAAWFGRKKAERKSDPLLSYVHHARNSDEHGIAEIMHKDTRGVFANGQHVEARNIVVDSRGSIVGGEVNTSGRWASVRETYRVSLVPVLDRGESYDPPTAHLGKPVEGNVPGAVALLAESYLASLLAEAAKL